MSLYCIMSYYVIEMYQHSMPNKAQMQMSTEIWDL